MANSKQPKKPSDTEQIIIPAALKTLNPAHIKDFGYWGEVL